MAVIRKADSPTSGPRVLFAGGASGGHILPAVAIAQEICERHEGARILFVTSDKQVDSTTLRAYPFRQVAQRAPKGPTSLTDWPMFAGRFASAVFRSMRIVRRFRPDVVVGTGAYASVPTVLAARLLHGTGDRIVLMEPNYSPGRATRALARFARAIVCTHEATARALRPWPARVLGTPVRREIETACRTRAYAHFQLDPRLKTLLILGGSQGSSGVNRTVTEAMPKLFNNGLAMNIIHQTGPAERREVEQMYWSLSLKATVLPFIEQIDLALAAADIAVSRAGAITLAEISARNIPSVLIPLPHAVEDDQRRNAKYMEERGAARVVEEGSGAAVNLARTLHELLKSPARTKAMACCLDQMARLNAREEIARLIVCETDDSGK